MIRCMRLYSRNGFWYVEFRRGKKRSLKTRDKKEAQRIFRELRREWLRGRLLHLDSNRRVTLHDFKEEYLIHRKGMSPKTYKQDSLSLRLLEDSIGGSILLQLVSTKRIDEFKQVCLARGAKPQSTNSYLRHIKCALSIAEEWEMIKRKPKIKMLPAENPLPHVLTPEQIDTILELSKRTNLEFWRFLVFYLWTGCRRAEALGLTWQDCYLGSENPHVILRKGKGKKHRAVPLLPSALEVLNPYKRDIGPVFIQVHPDTLTHWFKVLARQCGIESHLHDLRHTAATYMVASGISLRSVQEILGHAQFSTTQIYTHLVKDQLRKEMEKLQFKW